jgi:hypothetical protein
MTRRIPAAIVLAALAFLLPFVGWSNVTATLAGRDAKAAQENTESRVKIMRTVQAERKVTALIARIQRLSRGLIRQAQAEEIVRILRDRCDKAIKADMIMRLIDRESRWNPTAIGRHGEIGLTQVRPSSVGISASDLADPAKNVAAGIDHLRMLVDRTGSVPLALAAYNAGLYSPGVRYARAILGEE